MREKITVMSSLSLKTEQNQKNYDLLQNNDFFSNSFAFMSNFHMIYYIQLMEIINFRNNFHSKYPQFQTQNYGIYTVYPCFNSIYHIKAVACEYICPKKLRQDYFYMRCCCRNSVGRMIVSEKFFGLSYKGPVLCQPWTII